MSRPLGQWAFFDITRYDPRDPNHKGARGVMTVASTLLHRFYMRRSFKDFPEEVSVL